MSTNFTHLSPSDPDRVRNCPVVLGTPTTGASAPKEQIMRAYRVHRLRRHDDIMPEKVFRSLVFLVSVVVFAFVVFGFLRDAEAQFQAYSLPNGAGGWNYHSAPGYGDNSDGMLNLGIQMMQMGNQAEMQRRQHRHELKLQRRYQRPAENRWAEETWD